MGKPEEIPIGSTLREFPAGSFNALVRGHKRQKSQPPDHTRTKPRGLFGIGPWTVLSVVNESGAAVEPGGVLGLDGTVATVTDSPNQVYSAPELEGITPTTDDHSDAFVVALDKIEDGVAGPCVLLGAVWARVYVTDADHKYAKVLSGSTASLESGDSGARIIDHEALPVDEYEEPELPATVWAVVLLGGGGGSSARHLSAYAIVRVEAGASTHSSTGIAGGTIGECELLSNDGSPLGPQPDPNNNNELGDGYIEFKSRHRVACPVGSIVILDSDGPIEPFSKWDGQDETPDDGDGDDRHVWGRLIEATDYLSELTGFGAAKALYSDGSNATDIQWGSTECEEVT